MPAAAVDKFSWLLSRSTTCRSHLYFSSIPDRPSNRPQHAVTHLSPSTLRSSKRHTLHCVNHRQYSSDPYLQHWQHDRLDLLQKRLVVGHSRERQIPRLRMLVANPGSTGSSMYADKLVIGRDTNTGADPNNCIAPALVICCTYSYGYIVTAGGDKDTLYQVGRPRYR